MAFQTFESNPPPNFRRLISNENYFLPLWTGRSFSPIYQFSALRRTVSEKNRSEIEFGSPSFSKRKYPNVQIILQGVRMRMSETRLPIWKSHYVGQFVGQNCFRLYSRFLVLPVRDHFPQWPIKFSTFTGVSMITVHAAALPASNVSIKKHVHGKHELRMNNLRLLSFQHFLLMTVRLIFLNKRQPVAGSSSRKASQWIFTINFISKHSNVHDEVPSNRPCES